MTVASVAQYQSLDRTAAPLHELRQLRALSRAFAAQTPEAKRVAFARSFVERVIKAWWRAIMGDGAHSPMLRSPLHAFDVCALTASEGFLADDLGRIASEIDDEDAIYEIGLVYTGMLPSAFRGAHGAYYTPPLLAGRLIALAAAAGTDWTSARVLDPACGGGAFLAPVAQRMIAALPGCSPRFVLKNIAARLRGWEIDPFAAWMSQVALDIVLLPIARAAAAEPPILVEVCDSLRRDSLKDRFDLVIGNPPYGRVTLCAADRAQYHRSLFGHANLYGLFTDMALRCCQLDGVIAYVTPTGFLAGEYFKNLRSLMGHEAPPAAIDFVAARKGVFDDVLQETLLAAYRRGAPIDPVQVGEIVTGERNQIDVRPSAEAHLPVDLSAPWLLPRERGEASLVNRLTGMAARLVDWGYTVSTGPLVWNRHKDQLVFEPGPGRRPLIWAEAVDADGSFGFRAERRGHAPYFEVRRGDDWLLARSPCVLLQRTTAKEQKRRLVAAVLPEVFLDEHGPVVIENHLNMLRPVGAPRVGLDVLAAFLNSGAADRAFRCVSGSVAVSAYELESLPLPPPEALDDLSRLVSQSADRVDIEAACVRLYKGE